MAKRKPTRRERDAAIRRAVDGGKLTCPFPFDSFDACVAAVSEGGAEDPEALCGAWENECSKNAGDTMEEIKHLVTSLRVKQLDDERRTFEGLAATWDLDLGGDIIKKGAFRGTLAQWKRSGRVLPLLDSHSWFSIRHGVGRMVEAKETDEGLWTKWRIVPGADGDEIINRLRPDVDGSSFIDSMSIGYRALRWEMIEEDDEDAELKVGTRILKEIELHEVSLVLFPMNPAARVDVSTVKRAFADSVALALKQFPPAMRDEVRVEVNTRLTAEQPEPKPAPTPRVQRIVPKSTSEPQPEPKPARYVPKPDVDENEPDLNLLRQLRLRRLELSNRLTRGG